MAVGKLLRLVIGASAVAAIQLEWTPDELLEAEWPEDADTETEAETTREELQTPAVETSALLAETKEGVKKADKKGKEKTDVAGEGQDILVGLAESKVACADLPNVPRNVKAMFINLDSRKDRLDKFKAKIPPVLEPYKRCFDWSLERFPAIKADANINGGRHSGQVAAARSHVAVLKKSMEDAESPVLIFEDDFRFDGDAPKIAQRLENAFKNVNGSWDVMMLGDNSYDAGSEDGGKGQITHTTGAWCSEAYMVAPKYKATLLETVEKGLKKMEGGATHVSEEVEPLGAAYDTLWYPLQHKTGSKWFVFRPKIGEQENTWGDSNIN